VAGTSIAVSLLVILNSGVFWMRGCGVGSR
jgi:hypothetical protein